jgi:hypothetical protein
VHGRRGAAALRTRVARAARGPRRRPAGGPARRAGLVGGAGAPPGGAAPAHPNGALAVDHVVAFTDDLARTAAAVEAAGLPLRRVRRPPEVPAPAAFLPAGTLVVEVVETGVPPSWWGLVVAVADIDAAVDGLAGLVGAPRAAVQAGRRIATVRPEAGLSAALALMTPRG